MATVGITLAFAGLLASGLAYAADGGEADTAPKNAKASPSHVSHKTSKAASVGSADAVPAAPGPGHMQVEEPKTAAPVASARESKAWQKNHARGLTDAQKQAFRDRKEKMEGMIAVIKEKRKAMASAKPEERAAIARELHTLMLDNPAPAAAAGATARVADPAALEEKTSGGDGKKSEISEARRKQSEWRQQSHKSHSGDNDDD